jgi:DNA-binding protein H-NS
MSTVAIPRNLEALSYAQLTQLEQRVRTAKDRKYDQACVAADQQLRAKLGQIIQDLGIRAEDAPKIAAPATAGKSQRRRARGKVAIKFRDPNQPENTWTGRGRAPRWLTAAEKSGAKRQEFQVGA